MTSLPPPTPPPITHSCRSFQDTNLCKKQARLTAHLLRLPVVGQARELLDHGGNLAGPLRPLARPMTTKPNTPGTNGKMGIQTRGVKKRKVQRSRAVHRTAASTKHVKSCRLVVRRHHTIQGWHGTQVQTRSRHSLRAWYTTREASQ